LAGRIRCNGVEALHRRGRYQTLGNGLKIKDVLIDEGTAMERRFIVVKNPESEKRDQTVRAQIVEAAREKLSTLSQLSGKAMVQVGYF
jgi:hypothetical protein